jgi:hypothetical protein
MYCLRQLQRVQRQRKNIKVRHVSGFTRPYDCVLFDDFSELAQTLVEAVMLRQTFAIIPADNIDISRGYRLEYLTQ